MLSACGCFSFALLRERLVRGPHGSQRIAADRSRSSDGLHVCCCGHSSESLALRERSAPRSCLETLYEDTGWTSVQTQPLSEHDQLLLSEYLRGTRELACSCP